MDCCDIFKSCCDIDDDMVKDKDTPVIRKIIAGTLLVGLAVGLAIIAIYNFNYIRKLLPYYLRAGIPASLIPICGIASAGFSALSVILFIFYFFFRFCCGKCGCSWYFLNVLMYFGIIAGITTYILGVQEDEIIKIKCHKGLSDCYYGIYNKTLGKMNYNHSESYNRDLLDDWNEFYRWYLIKLNNIDDICDKALKVPLTVEIVLIIAYIILLFVMGGCKCIVDKLCFCCCCCKCCKSKDQSSSENYVEDTKEKNMKNSDISAPNQNSKEDSDQCQEPNVVYI